MDTSIQLKPPKPRIRPVRTRLTRSGFLYQVEMAGARSTQISMASAWRVAIDFANIYRLIGSIK